MSTRSDLEHARQMAAVHQARAQLRALTSEERRAHHEMGKRYDREAQLMQRTLDQREAGR